MEAYFKRMTMIPLMLLVLLFLGQAIPRVLLPPPPDPGGAREPSKSMAQLEPSQEKDREFAKVAHLYAYLLACTGPEAVFCTGTRVVEVSPLSPIEADGCQSAAYTAKVRVHTLFGVPYDTVIVTQHGSDCSIEAYRLGGIE